LQREEPAAWAEYLAELAEWETTVEADVAAAEE
jgi:hypothetical protein